MEKLMRKRTLVAAGLLVLLAVQAFAAGGKEAETKQKTIGMSIHFMKDDYAVNLLKSAEAVIAAHPGYKLVAVDANANPPKQLADVENLLAQKIDCLVVIPFDEKAILPAMRQANSQKVPIVAVTYIPNADVVTTVGTNGDYENGKSSGELLVKKIGGKGKVAVIDVGFSVWRIDERIRGFEDSLKGTGVQIVARQSGVDANDVQDKVAGILLANPDLNGVWATFSTQIIGAANAVKAAGRKDIAVSGIDADKAILALIKEGWVTGVAAQFPREHGKLAIQLAIDILEGKSVQKGYEVPVKVVTAENADVMRKTIWGE